MKNEKGFSLVELLVVVIIIAIIAAIAIPNLLASRRAANEASAIQSMRTYHSAQATFQALSATRDFSADAAGLLTAGLVDTTLGTNGASKSGYTMTVSGAVADATNPARYCAGATPQAGQGTNHFGVSSGNGGVVVQLATTLNCTGGALTNAGTPVQ